MKKSIIATVIALALMAPLTYANGLGVFATYWDTKDADDEFGAGAKLKFNFDDGVALEIRGSFFQFEDEEAGLKATLDVIPVEVGLVFSLAPQGEVQPYIGGGAGYYIMEMELSGGGGKVDLDVDNEIGFYAVAGLELMLADNIGIFVEGKYTWLEIEKVEDLDAEVKLDGFGGNAGLIIKW